MGFSFCQYFIIFGYIYYIHTYTYIYIYSQIYISINSLFTKIVLVSRSQGKSETERDSNLYLVVEQNFLQAEVWGKSLQSDP